MKSFRFQTKTSPNFDTKIRTSPPLLANADTVLQASSGTSRSVFLHSKSFHSKVWSFSSNSFFFLFLLQPFREIPLFRLLTF